MEKIESFDQAKQAQVMNVGDDYSPQTGPHPAQVVPFFTSRSSPTSLDHKRPMAFSPQTLLYNPATVPQLTSTGQQYVSAERDKYTKMKLRKEAKKDRAERKFKTVINDGDQENYNIDNVLQKLGEVSTVVDKCELNDFESRIDWRPFFSHFAWRPNPEKISPATRVTTVTRKARLSAKEVRTRKKPPLKTVISKKLAHLPELRTKMKMMKTNSVKIPWNRQRHPQTPPKLSAQISARPHRRPRRQW